MGDRGVERRRTVIELGVDVRSRSWSVFGEVKSVLGDGLGLSAVVVKVVV